VGCSIVTHNHRYVAWACGTVSRQWIVDMRGRKAWICRLPLAVEAILALLMSALPAAAQSQPAPSARVKDGQLQGLIRVRSNLAVLRVEVLDKKRLSAHMSVAEKQCGLSLVAAYQRLGASEPFLPADCLTPWVHNLTATDFHVLVDGEEQKIEKVLTDRGDVNVRDNFGRHDEYSEGPTGRWSTTDLPGVEGLEQERYIYNIAFVPSEAEKPGCHKVKVKVDRRNSLVKGDDEYCTEQSPSDALNGSKFGGQMEQDLDSQEDPKISLSLQAGFFLADDGKARAEIALEFPWEALHRQWGSDWILHASIGVLGVLYKTDGSLATRFSDFACCSGASSVYAQGYGGRFIDPNSFTNPNDPNSPTNWGNQLALKLLSLHDIENIPTHYETQVELPPGAYRFRVVLSDGEKFGRAEAPLAVDTYDGKTLALSSVLLCNRFRDAHVAAVEAAAANFAPQYIPLVSKGTQVTPTGDTRFKAGDPLIPYFEIYEPLLVAAPATAVQAHIKIVDATTGQLRDDFAVDAAPFEQPGKWAIPIARQIATDKMARGAYRLEVQASDSAGRTTTVRTASFSIE